MNRHRLHLIESLFSEAVALDEAHLESFLNKSCGNDEALKRSVFSLVKRDREVGPTNFLEPSRRNRPDLNRDLDAMVGKLAGPFEISRCIAMEFVDGLRINE